MLSFVSNLFSFTHPKKVCMTYMRHFWFSMSLCRRFAVGSIQAFIHAVLPDYYITSSSDLIAEIKNDMSKIGCRDELDIIPEESKVS
jgi:hypothetical protein